MRYTTVMLFVSTVATLSSVLLFGFAHSLAFIVAFTLLFGLAAGSWCATWGPSALDVARARNAQSANVVLSFAVVRGAAALVGPLVAAALYEPQRAGERVPFGSFGFAPLIAFVGACMLAATALVLPTEAARRASLRDVDVRAFRERL
jgi:MFS family permease